MAAKLGDVDMEDNNLSSTIISEKEDDQQTQHCKKCGAELKDGSSYCSKCGTPTKRICSKCQTVLDDSHEYCPNCGTKYSDPTSSISIQDSPENEPVAIQKNRKPLLVALAIILLLVGGYFIYSALSKPNIETPNIETPNIERPNLEMMVEDFVKSHDYCRYYVYGEMGMPSCIKIGSNGDWIKIDSNPTNLENNVFNKSELEVYNDVAGFINRYFINNLGFSSVVIEKQNNTSYSMGYQTAESDLATAEWIYHPDKGLEVTYTLK